MRGKVIKSIAILLMLVPTHAFASENVVANEQARFITEYYRHILDFNEAGREKFLSKTPFFSKSLLALMAKNRQICKEKSRGDDMCGFGDGDIYLDTQQTGPDLNFENSEFKASPFAPNLIEASFTVWPKDHDFYKRKIRFRLVKEKSSWRVDDMIFVKSPGSGGTATEGSDSGSSMRKQIETENENVTKADRSFDEAWSWITIYISSKNSLDRVSKLTSFPIEICEKKDKCKKASKSDSEIFKKALLQLNDYYGDEGESIAKPKHEWPLLDTEAKAKLSLPKQKQTTLLGPLTLIFKKEAWWLSRIQLDKIGK